MGEDGKPLMDLDAPSDRELSPDPDDENDDRRRERSPTPVQDSRKTRKRPVEKVARQDDGGGSPAPYGGEDLDDSAMEKREHMAEGSSKSWSRGYGRFFKDQGGEEEVQELWNTIAGGDSKDRKGLYDDKCESRLYVGNLDHRITESNVIKMFSPFGKIVSEDFLWHTRGPKRGEPRGFAFIEYSTKEEAQLAKTKMDGRLVGRPLVVRFASEKDPVEATRRGGTSSTSRKSSVASGTAGQMTRGAMIVAIRNKLKSLEEGCSKKRTKCDP